MTETKGSGSRSGWPAWSTPSRPPRALAEHTGTRLEDAVHLALVRYASDGAEALLALEPAALRQLIRARRAEDWTKVAGIIDWLDAGLQSSSWRQGRGTDGG